MTLTTFDTIVTHAGNSVATVFTFPFKVFEKTDLVVYTTTGATVTTLTLDTGYTVSGLRNGSGGSITTTVPVATGTTITIKRQLLYKQDVDLRNQSKFYPETHEDEFDRLTMMLQQLATKVALAAGEVAPSGVVSWGEIQGSLASQVDLSTALGLKAPLASPTFTGIPAGPTASPGANTTQLATMAAIYAERSATKTLTNTRLDRRVTKIVTGATATPDADATDLFCITALNQGLTIANPTGTPTDGQILLMRIEDNGTTRSLTWGSAYEGDIVLPTATVAGKHMTFGFLYNTDNALNKWCLVGFVIQA